MDFVKVLGSLRLMGAWPCCGAARFPAGSWEVSSFATLSVGSPLGSFSRGSLAAPQQDLT
ncbi:hypothetical protein GCM10011389_33750 [Pontibacillus salipaludis]|uniref:Uncharacterized protein n=1 Tax=Pontibacillus salipaludis TaxID=1697394 RepID=A0ABQ1QCU2_9BACI|nr:hypothetical protein GCM10011389_33750 [Pontibacillus salipaludis]